LLRRDSSEVVGAEPACAVKALDRGVDMSTPDAVDEAMVPMRDRRPRVEARDRRELGRSPIEDAEEVDRVRRMWALGLSASMRATRRSATMSEWRLSAQPQRRTQPRDMRVNPSAMATRSAGG